MACASDHRFRHCHLPFPANISRTVRTNGAHNKRLLQDHSLTTAALAHPRARARSLPYSKLHRIPIEIVDILN